MGCSSGPQSGRPIGISPGASNSWPVYFLVHRPCPRRGTKQPEAEHQVREHLKKPNLPLEECWPGKSDSSGLDWLTSQWNILSPLSQAVFLQSFNHICSWLANKQRFLDQSDDRSQASWAVNLHMLDLHRITGCTVSSGWHISKAIHLIWVTYLPSTHLLIFLSVVAGVVDTGAEYRCAIRLLLNADLS